MTPLDRINQKINQFQKITGSDPTYVFIGRLIFDELLASNEIFALSTDIDSIFISGFETLVVEDYEDFISVGI